MTTRLKTVAILTMLFNSCFILFANKSTCIQSVDEQQSTEHILRHHIIERLKFASFSKDKNRVTLRDGSYEYPRDKDGTPNGEIHLDVNSVVLSKTANHGKQELAFVLIESDGGNACWSILHIARYDNGKIIDLGSANLGNIPVQPICLDGSRVSAEIGVYDDSDLPGRPSNKQVRTFLLNGGRLLAEASPAEQDQLFRELLTCIGYIAVKEVTIATNSNAIYAIKELRAGIRRQELREKKILEQIRRFRLLRDPTFRKRIWSKAQEYRNLFEQKGGLKGIQHLTPDQQQAYLLLDFMSLRLASIVEK